MGRFSDGKNKEKQGSLSGLREKGKKGKEKAEEQETEEKDESQESETTDNTNDKTRRSYMLTQEQIGKLYQLRGMKYPDKTLSDIIGFLIEKESLE